MWVGGSSLRGCIILNCFDINTDGIDTGYQSRPASDAVIDRDIPGSFYGLRFKRFLDVSAIVLPNWFAVAMSAGAAVAPWIRWQFSLRTLLIATMLVAVVLGIIVWLNHH